MIDGRNLGYCQVCREQKPLAELQDEIIDVMALEPTESERLMANPRRKRVVTVCTTCKPTGKWEQARREIGNRLAVTAEPEGPEFY